MGGVNDAAELDQKSVTGGLDYTSSKLGNLRIKKFTLVRPECRERAFLVGTHKAAVTRNIGREDSRQSSFDTRLRHRERPDLFWFCNDFRPPWVGVSIGTTMSARVNSGGCAVHRDVRFALERADIGLRLMGTCQAALDDLDGFISLHRCANVTASA
jgi:hypothetical protein